MVGLLLLLGMSWFVVNGESHIGRYSLCRYGTLTVKIAFYRFLCMIALCCTLAPL